MAFVSSSPLLLSSFTHGFAASPRRPKSCTSSHRIVRFSATDVISMKDDDDAQSSSAAMIPGSLAAACEQARLSVQAALSTGQRRMFIEVDISNGDATYTALKNSLPSLQLLLPGLFPGRVRVLLPDSGAAALAKRDWPELDESKVTLGSIEDGGAQEGDDAVVIVVPRASETEALSRVAENTGDVPLLVLNPDLVDMGVTGLSLNARRLRERLIDSFDTVYYLRVFEWGVMLREFPGSWGVWVDDPGSEIGFRMVSEFDSRPSTDTLAEALDAVDGAGDGGGLGGMVASFRRFVGLYMKG